MGSIESRSVPGETKDTTCMLMHCETFRVGSGAEAGDKVVLLYKRLRAIKQKQKPKIDSRPAIFFLTSKQETR